MAALFIATAILLAVGYHVGHRRNRALIATILRAVHECFRPGHSDVAELGNGIGIGFDFHDSEGPALDVQGILTTLPRYAPMYMPVARLLGRSDLLKLTFHCSNTLVPGVGGVVNETRRGWRWSAVERDDDWQETRTSDGVHKYRVYFYNPGVGRRLEAVVPQITAIDTFNQIGVDSRSGTVTAFITPRAGSIRKDLDSLLEIVFSLTASQSRVTV